MPVQFKEKIIFFPWISYVSGVASQSLQNFNENSCSGMIGSEDDDGTIAKIHEWKLFPRGESIERWKYSGTGTIIIMLKSIQ